MTLGVPVLRGGPLLQGGRFRGLPELLWGLAVQEVPGHLEGEETVTTPHRDTAVSGAPPITPGAGTPPRAVIIPSTNIYWDLAGALRPHKKQTPPCHQLDVPVGVTSEPLEAGGADSAMLSRNSRSSDVSLLPGGAGDARYPRQAFESRQTDSRLPLETQSTEKPVTLRAEVRGLSDLGVHSGELFCYLWLGPRRRLLRTPQCSGQSPSRRMTGPKCPYDGSRERLPPTLPGTSGCFPPPLPTGHALHVETQDTHGQQHRRKAGTNDSSATTQGCVLPHVTGYFLADATSHKTC